MSLDNYDGLVAEIADWLNRQDLVSKIPTFVRMLEAQVNRKLRTHQMMQRSTASITTDYTALPDDFRALYSAILLTDPVVPLDYVTPSEMSSIRSKYTPRTPFAYSIVGSALEVGPPPDQAYPIEIVYYKQIPYLSVDNETNWLLAEHPDVYLWGSLLMAAPYLNNDDRVGVWGSALSSVLEEIMVSDERALRGGTALKARIKPYA